MKRLMLILISSICLFGNSDLEKERELELQRFKSYLDIESLSNDCKTSIKDLIKKNIEYNIAFDNLFLTSVKALQIRTINSKESLVLAL